MQRYDECHFHWHVIGINYANSCSSAGYFAGGSWHIGNITNISAFLNSSGDTKGLLISSRCRICAFNTNIMNTRMCASIYTEGKNNCSVFKDYSKSIQFDLLLSLFHLHPIWAQKPLFTPLLMCM